MKLRTWEPRHLIRKRGRCEEKSPFFKGDRVGEGSTRKKGGREIFSFDRTPPGILILSSVPVKKKNDGDEKGGGGFFRCLQPRWIWKKGASSGMFPLRYPSRRARIKQQAAKKGVRGERDFLLPGKRHEEKEVRFEPAGQGLARILPLLEKEKPMLRGGRGGFSSIRKERIKIRCPSG